MTAQLEDVGTGQPDNMSILAATLTGGEPARADGLTGVVQSETLPVLEETLRVSKRRVKTGSVKVSIRTEFHEEVAKLSLERGIVDITQVPMDRVVDEAPQVRIEGDTTIVPVLEERFVLVKQLVLVQELHIRRRIDREDAAIPVSLRRQQVVVERLDADGQPVA